MAVGGRLPRLTGRDPRPLSSLAPAQLVGDTVLQVVAGPANAATVPLDLLDEPPEILDVLRRTVASLDGPPPPLRPGWYSSTFLDDVARWVDGLGLRRTAPPEPVKFWSLSAVLRVEHEGGTAYLKACSPHFHDEPALTRVLSAHLGDAVPTVLGVDEPRGWLLMEALPEGTPDPVATAGVLARLQVQMSGHIGALAAAGAPDRGAVATLAAFETVVEDGIETPTLEAAERRQLHDLLPWLAEQLARLDACGLPPTVVHGDMHLGNVVSDGNRIVVYDWSDTCVGIPVVDLPAVLWRVDESRWAEVQEAYAAVWREHSPAANIETALSLAPLANDVFQAVSYEAIARDLEPPSRWELAGVTPVLLRRLIATHEESMRHPG